MKPSEEKADLAAPADNKCDKCFAPLPAGAAICPDCGAPVNDASPAEAEAAVYPELARANLARMRGDYKQAEDQLLSILKRYHNNPSANEMLGDLAAEREDWPHAVEWYELALEIVPTSASIARKIKDARSKIDRKDTQATTVQLGLPDPSSKVPIFIAVGIVLLLAAFAGVFYLGTRQRGPVAQNSPPQVISAQPSTGVAKTPESGAPAETREPPMTGEESSILNALRKAEDGGAVLSVTTDPRMGSLRITFASDAQNMRGAAARLARDAFAAQQTYNLVTLRGVTDGVVTYMADVDRSKVAETQTPEFQQSQPPIDWISHVLTNEWPRTSPAPPAGDQPDSPAGEPTNGDPNQLGTKPPEGQ